MFDLQIAYILPYCFAYAKGAFMRTTLQQQRKLITTDSRNGIATSGVTF